MTTFDRSQNQSGDQSPDHPDDDLLADLGDGLLAGPEAEVVEAHVVACETCLQLLERSEALAGPLRQLPAEPMPAEVLARLDRVLAGEATGSNDRVADSGPTRILKPMTAAGASRMVRPGSGARRQQRDEERGDDRSSRLLKYGRWAAAAVLVVCVGTAAAAGIRSQTSDSGAGGATAASAGDSGAESRAALTPVLATGTNYDEDGLKGQITKLVQTSRDSAPVSALQESDSAGSGEQTYSTARSLLATPGTGLTDPATLAACMTAIGRGGQQPVAVDLARYQNREAAVIVLEEPTGRLDVWVVARTCARGSDETFAVETIQP